MSFNEAIITVQRRGSEPSSRVFLAERLDETSVDEFVIGEEHEWIVRLALNTSMKRREKEEHHLSLPLQCTQSLSHSFVVLFSRMSAFSIPSEESTSDDEQSRDLDVAAIWSDDIEQSFRVSERLIVR